jgi:hypothetical protein
MLAYFGFSGYVRRFRNFYILFGKGKIDTAVVGVYY